MKNLFAAALALSVALSGLAGAKENYKEKVFNADTADKFQSTADNVRKELGPGGRYQYVKPDERKKVDAALTDMSRIFAEHGAVAQMSQDTKVALFNDQELVNSILQQRDGERVICKNEAPIGSHIPVTKCHTYAQEVEAREGSRKQMASWGQGSCSASAASAQKGAMGGAQCLMHGNP